MGARGERWGGRQPASRRGPRTLDSLAAATAVLAVLAPSAAANHSFPATYTGSVDGGGTIEFDVSPDGTAVTRIAVTGFNAFPCATSFDATTSGSFPISGTPHSFSRSSSFVDSFSGTFDAVQHAMGTYTGRLGSCSTPTRSWTATTTAPPPPNGNGDTTPPPNGDTTPPPNGGARDEFERTLSLSYSQKKDKFKGKITSESPDCISDEKVKVFEKKKGNDPKQGSDTTNEKGKYTLKEKNADGKFYAEVKQTNGSAGTCLAAKSKTIKVG